MRITVYLFALILCFACETNTQNLDILEVDVSSELVKPEHYVVGKTHDSITIDGLASEESWKRSLFSRDFIDIEGVKTPRLSTKLKMLWDDEHLYIYAEMQEPHIWGYLKQRDTIIFYNNDFEVFIDPSPTTLAYGEIEINALNTVWDLKLDKPYRVGGHPDNTWDISNFKSAIKHYGSLNDARDIDSLWTVEMAIPISEIQKIDGLETQTVNNSTVWRINFSRVEWDFELVNGIYYRKKDNDQFLPEYNWVWSNQKVINMHEPEKWGYVHFSNATTTDTIHPTEVTDEELIQAGYALFRKINNGKLSYLKETFMGYEQQIDLKISDDNYLPSKFTKSANGYTIMFTNDHTPFIYSLDEDGFMTKTKK